MINIVEIHWVLKCKIPAWSTYYRFVQIQSCCTFVLFSFKFYIFVRYFKGIKKWNRFERNPWYWDSFLMLWTWNNSIFAAVWKQMLHFFHNKYGRKFKESSISIHYFMCFTHFWNITWVKVENIYVSLQLLVQNQMRKWHSPLNFWNGINWTGTFPLN